MKFDAIVLGAGIVGVCVADHLQQMGMAVALVDRNAPGMETSFGNAGLIQREGVYPYAFPRALGDLLRYAGNKALDVRYHADAMAELAPFLWRYWRNSHPARHAKIARSYSTLIEHCVTEHRALAEQAGANDLIRASGWMKVFRTDEKLDREIAVVERWRREYGVDFEALDPARLRQLEPSLDQSLVGAVRFTEAESVTDPGALVTAYARHFEKLGGRLFLGDAATLREGWSVQTEHGAIESKRIVLALGPWSAPIANRLGYRLPLGIKRGYHMHYEAQSQARLDHPVLDVERGYLLAPMARGIRLTTGAELARCDAPKTPVQLDAVEPIARSLFPLGARIDAQPWMGRRPCTPDMLPIIGPAPKHEGMWFAFGHAHHGLTLGPVTGRLLAQMMSGKETIVDPSPFRVERF
ncbi:amino acid dehydrogenase [Trinickia dabaoshanensis]|uniref:Amino acid dehydrogenase n=1 Tax=Trinickia dabaoshanensis TaxID=564714 RepID=A0A2N7VHM2_9BURK|nr:FAD-binding oxidoreductase [Trinickia dabaoshanensis]PMS16650.1 amino acid dehydrogenase [Trinickia dabaoshanensis]